MYLLRMGEETYKIVFNYRVFMESDIMEKLMDSVNLDPNNPTSIIQKIVGTTADLLLEGLQAKHSDEFGYNDAVERKEKLRKVMDLMDRYDEVHEDDGKDCFSLYEDLQHELENNRFLSRLIGATAETAAEQEATVVPTDHQRKQPSKRKSTGQNK